MPESPREEVRVYRQHYACDECGEPMMYAMTKDRGYVHWCINSHHKYLDRAYPLITYAALEAPRA